MRLENCLKFVRKTTTLSNWQFLVTTFPADRSICNVPDRTHSCRHTALSEISSRIVGVKITRDALSMKTHCFPSNVGFTNIFVWSTTGRCRQRMTPPGGRQCSTYFFRLISIVIIFGIHRNQVDFYDKGEHLRDMKHAVHDREVMGLNPGQVEPGMLGTSA